jgi:hypothetical protein
MVASWSFRDCDVWQADKSAAIANAKVNIPKCPIILIPFAGVSVHAPQMALALGVKTALSLP